MEREDDVKRFNEVAIELVELYTKKNADYENSFSRTYKEFGIVSAATRISDKFNRFKNMCSGRGEPCVRDEKMRDTLLDLASYAIMTIVEIDKDGENC